MVESTSTSQYKMTTAFIPIDGVSYRTAFSDAEFNYSRAGDGRGNRSGEPYDETYAYYLTPDCSGMAYGWVFKENPLLSGMSRSPVYIHRVLNGDALSESVLFVADFAGPAESQMQSRDDFHHYADEFIGQCVTVETNADVDGLTEFRPVVRKSFNAPFSVVER